MSKQKLSGFGELKNLVYSTNQDLNQQLSQHQPEETPAIPASQQNLRVWIEKNHRGGKIATIVRGFEGSDKALKELGKKLKNHCGTGGSEKDGEIILQGNMADKVLVFLKNLGFQVKRAGG